MVKTTLLKNHEKQIFFSRSSKLLFLHKKYQPHIYKAKKARSFLIAGAFNDQTIFIEQCTSINLVCLQTGGRNNK